MRIECYCIKFKTSNTKSMYKIWTQFINVATWFILTVGDFCSHLILGDDQVVGYVSNLISLGDHLAGSGCDLSGRGVECCQDNLRSRVEYERLASECPWLGLARTGAAAVIPSVQLLWMWSHVTAILQSGSLSSSTDPSNQSSCSKICFLPASGLRSFHKFLKYTIRMLRSVLHHIACILIFVNGFKKYEQIVNILIFYFKLYLDCSCKSYAYFWNIKASKSLWDPWFWQISQLPQK